MKKYLKIFISIIVFAIIIYLLIYNYIFFNTIQILGRRIKNEQQYIVLNEKTKYVHLSIDDTIAIFEDLTENKDNYSSIFENKTLKFLRELNLKYGAVFSLYVFYEFQGMKLPNMTDKFKEEFERNSNWLKFGFHAYNQEKDWKTIQQDEMKNDYSSVINELKRIVGENSITQIVRLDRFNITLENAKAISNIEYGITGLLGADSADRENYYLNDEQSKMVHENEYYEDEDTNIYFFDTDLRIENMNDNMEEQLNSMSEDNDLIIFTHEWKLNNNIKEKINKICEWAVENGYVFSFPIER